MVRCHREPSALRFTLLAVAPPLSFVVLRAGWLHGSHGGRLSFPQQLPLPLDVLALRVDALLLPEKVPTSHQRQSSAPCAKPECGVGGRARADLMRF